MPLRRRALLAAGALWAAQAGANAPQSTAVPAEVAAHLPGATFKGAGRLRFLGLLIYDCLLYTSRCV